MIKATTMQVDSDRYQIAMQWNQKYNWPFLHSKPDFLVKVHMVVCPSNVTSNFSFYYKYISLKLLISIQDCYINMYMSHP